LGKVDVEGRIISKWILKKMSIQLAEDREQLWAPVVTAIKLRVLYKAGNLIRR
jgi:hypothetical protein